MKTLVVEDDFTSRLLLQQILKPYGAVHTAVNGKEAVEAVRRSLESAEPYDLICLDIAMPEMDGQQALREIRELEQAAGMISPIGSKVVMTTAYSDRDNVLAALLGRCDYFLTKPIHAAKLMSAVRKLLLI